MSIFSRNKEEKRGLIDRIKFDGSYEELIWKFPHDNITIGCQLIVNETQEAVFVKGGQVLDCIGAGTHTLSTNNIPLLQKVVNLPFGGKTPFSAEVWYINKTVKRDTKWGTKDPMKLQDPIYKIIVPIRAYGQYGFSISDSRLFLKKMIGTLSSFDIDDLQSRFSALVISKIKDIVAGYIVKRTVSILELPASISEISDECKLAISDEFSDYGICIENFHVESINLPDDDPSIEKLQNALAKKAEMGLLEYTYQQERTYDTLQTAAGNEGTASSVMGAGIGLGVGLGVGGAVGRATQEIGNQMSIKGNETQLTCARCGSTLESNSKFCGNCGEIVQRSALICPECGTKNEMNAKFCSNCGYKIAKNVCPKCGDELADNAKFCANCGHKIVT